MANEIVLKHQITALPKASDFEIRNASLRDLNDGEILVRVIYVSLDPYVGSVLRGRHMQETIPGEGDVTPGGGIGEVIETRAADFSKGDLVITETGWRSHAIVDATTARKTFANAAPLSAQLGVAGMPGLTAWAGITKLAKVKQGDNVLISSAAGGVGGAAGQIARIEGAEKVIGIAGSDEKCDLVKNVYGFDDCLNYKSPEWKSQLKTAFPDGIDVYFDNVGGDLLNTALENLALYGRVVLCGLASQYHADDRPAGPNPGTYIGKRAQLFGLVVYDFYPEQEKYTAIAGNWIKEGKLIVKEDRAENLKNAPVLFEKLMLGENIGKALVAVGSEETGH